MLVALPAGLRAPLQLVWLAGSPILTGLLALLAAGRGRGRAWRVGAGFLGVVTVEALLKALLPTPSPPLQPVTWPWLREWLGFLSPSPAHVGLALFRGTFPSGHVARITFAGWLLASGGGRRPGRGDRAAAWLAFLGALAVVATGGHWLWDALGGALLGWSLARWTGGGGGGA
ncbi:MAG: phosphatase PAP2 family protein [Bacillota bacterium]|nr:phosphatase PAP2 family protein [Bacillota bacterium]